MNKVLLIVSMAVVVVISLTTNVNAGGFDNSGIGLKGFSMGSAYTGVADDASAVYYNPAGLSFNEKDKIFMEAYGYFIFPDFEYKANSITDEGDDVAFVPGFFISKTYENWAFGLGFYVPLAGAGMNYENFQKSGLDLESWAGFSAFTPTVAYRISSNLSIGMGLSLYMGRMMDKFFIPPPGPGAVKTEYEGYAGYGGNIGLMYKPTEKLGIGFSIISEVEVDIDGDETEAGVKNDSEAEFTLPYNFKLGFGYKPNSDITLSFAINYQLYGSMNKITIKTDGKASNVVPTNYDNCWDVGLGVDYRINQDFTILGGLKYSQAATEAQGINPRTDVDFLEPMLGVGYNISDAYEIIATGMYTYGFEEKHNSQSRKNRHILFLFGVRCKI